MFNKLWHPTVFAGILFLILGLASAPVYASPNYSGIPNPAQNAKPGYYLTCSLFGNHSNACETAIIHDINQVQTQEGARSLVLPPGYNTLTPAEQIFVLSNLERVDFGLPPIAGMNLSMNQFALTGAQNNTDPYGGTLSTGQTLYTWASNWASDINPLSADFNWMFNDGLNSFNIDCSNANPSGCWGHRDNILLNVNDVFTENGWSSPPTYQGIAGAASTTVNGQLSMTYILGAVKPNHAAIPVTFTWQDVLNMYPNGTPFGNPTSPTPSPSPPYSTPKNGQLVTLGSSSQLYEYLGGVLYPVTNNLQARTIAGSSTYTVEKLPNSVPYVIGAPTMVPYHSGTILYDAMTGHTYFVLQGILYPFTNTSKATWLVGAQPHPAITITTLPIFWPMGSIVPKAEFPYYNGELLRFGKAPAVYIAWQGKIHYITNPTVFLGMGLTWGEINHFNWTPGASTMGSPVGTPVPWVSSGTLIRAKGHHAVYLVLNSQLVHFSNVQSFLNQGAQWNQVQVVPYLPNLPIGSSLN